WPDNALASRSWLKATAQVTAALIVAVWLRLRGSRIVWTAHNMRSHEQNHPRLERWFWAAWWRLVDGVIFHSRAAQSRARDAGWLRFPRATVVIPLSEFGPMYDVPLTPHVRVSKPRRIGFVGRIRRYKGVEQLIAAFRGAALNETRLVIAGKPETPEEHEAILKAATDSASIELHLRFLPEAEMITLIKSCDLIVLPFASITNSGSTLLALSCGTPVLVPENDYFEELQEEIGSEWVHMFSGELTSAALQHALADVAATSEQRGERPSFPVHRSVGWAAQSTIAFYQRVLSS